MRSMQQEPDEPVQWPQQKGQVEVPTMRPGYTKPLTAYELWHLHKVRRELRREYLEHWQATISKTGTGRPVDAIIAPVAPFVAPPHGMNKFAVYTATWNNLDYPALVIPVTKTDPRLDVKKPPHRFFSDIDKVMYEFCEYYWVLEVAPFLRVLDDPNRFANAPVAVQIVGRTQEDEAVIGMAEIVDRAVKEAGAGSQCKL